MLQMLLDDEIDAAIVRVKLPHARLKLVGLPKAGAPKGAMQTTRLRTD